MNDMARKPKDVETKLSLGRTTGLDYLVHSEGQVVAAFRDKVDAQWHSNTKCPAGASVEDVSTGD